MSEDITEFLNAWPYTPGQPTVRLIRTSEGVEKIQIRLDLGVLQMNAEGRPDGQRPHGYESLLDYFEDEMDDAADQPPEERPKLSEDDCRSLRDEAAQYYHRYMALLVLEDYVGVLRDATRNLRLLDFLAEHAETDADKESLADVRPHLMMIRARAVATQAVKDEEGKAALVAIDLALEDVKRAFAEGGKPQAFDESPEVEMLRNMRQALAPKLPVSQKAELKARLQKAIEEENYELAAILRDELKQLKD
ncbi:MAG: UvrB/UvrC motif-containing protein [Phycisphaeraceae bacterium]|nr:MAG: UvrB/UvrC motif-containing protein [Phycisphaeraceae bacterium]